MTPIDRVDVKQAAMDRGVCKAEFVDQLCERCWTSGRECPYVPERAGEKAKGQTKKGSALEAVTNMVVGLVVAWLTGLVVYPLLGIEVSHAQNAVIILLFTVVSLVRSYTLRRIFNYISNHNRCQTQ